MKLSNYSQDYKLNWIINNNNWLLFIGPTQWPLNHSFIFSVLATITTSSAFSFDDIWRVYKFCSLAWMLPFKRDQTLLQNQVQMLQRELEMRIHSHCRQCIGYWRISITTYCTITWPWESSWAHWSTIDYSKARGNWIL